MFSAQRFQQLPIIGILRHVTPPELAEIVKCYISAELTTLEITLNTEGALEMIAQCAAKYGEHLNIGAGTVKTLDDLEAARNAGAQFIVTPILNKEVIHVCKEAKIPVFPGAYTPTEVYEAWSLGATAVKIFPAAHGGVAYLKALKGPLDEVAMAPTGGVTLDNFQAFFQAGAAAVGMGGKLFVKEFIQTQNWEALTDHFRKFVALYQEFRN